MHSVGSRWRNRVRKKCMGAEYTDHMTRSLRWLKDDIALRMMQKLEVLKHQPRSLLILPDAIGIQGRLLAKRFPRAASHCVIESGAALDRLALKATRTAQFIKNGIPSFSYLSTPSLAVPDQSQDMVFSNLWMQDLQNPSWSVEEAWRILREGGLFTFSYLGPDTGKELRALDLSQSRGLGVKNLPGAWDMHDLGDALVKARFADPVMDMEYLTLEYESDALYIQDAIALGLLSADKSLHALGSEPPFLPKKMTLELVYGHAWVVNKHLSKAKDALAFISPEQIKRKITRDYKQE